MLVLFKHAHMLKGKWVVCLICMCYLTTNVNIGMCVITCSLCINASFYHLCDEILSFCFLIYELGMCFGWNLELNDDNDMLDGP